MTQVKICGLRDQTIARQLADATIQPAYVGFVFADSRRKVTMEQAQQLSRMLGSSMQKVGVFVNHSQDEIKTIAEFCQLDVLQLHGNESPEFCSALAEDLPKKIWKAFSVRSSIAVADIVAYRGSIDGMLLDTYDPKAAGGTGKPFDWSKISEYRALLPELPLIVAGGIRIQNVDELIHAYHPDLIDVSSGIEGDDGTQCFPSMISLLERVYSL
ncbi:phosphoribosylanthranilate isomerase [Fodinisporobacter ferrooxydans]|uniref:N-(5'-phosphoribosyl)anthranilate isomerase n=1 Tax=Fodinisporobacter ferrooxydans TaxID=2901836 RepID=A0ABY4CGR7_9BACL|nr:phosphoribosylanthranilate isomerase [Alicyclobacillaceae bacterium MYW30-H2]